MGALDHRARGGGRDAVGVWNARGGGVPGGGNVWSEYTHRRRELADHDRVELRIAVFGLIFFLRVSAKREGLV